MTTLGGTTPLSSAGVSAVPSEVGQYSRNEDKDVKRGVQNRLGKRACSMSTGQG